MNKFLLPLCFAALLVGCGEKDKNTVSEPPAAQQEAPAAPATGAQEEQKSETANSDSAVLVMDGTSDEAMEESVEKIVANMSEDEQERFGEALMIFMLSHVDMSLSEEANKQNMMAALNGKSAQDIIDAAEKIKADAQ